MTSFLLSNLSSGAAYASCSLPLSSPPPVLPLSILVVMFGPFILRCEVKSCQPEGVQFIKKKLKILLSIVNCTKVWIVVQLSSKKCTHHQQWSQWQSAFSSGTDGCIQNLPLCLGLFRKFQLLWWNIKIFSIGYWVLLGKLPFSCGSWWWFGDLLH